MIGKLAGLVAVLAAVAVMAGCSGPGLLSGLTPSGGYQTHEGIAYGDHRRQRLDVHVPQSAEPAAPVVVFLYGGRWQSGSRSGYRFMAEALTSRGFVTVIPDYRLHPEVRFPAFVEDGAAALAWVRSRIGAYGGDADRVFLMGHSAGAHIAALLALDERYLAARGESTDAVAGFIGLSGPYDFLPFTADYLRDIFAPPEQYARTQPINFARGDAPPMLLIHGESDRTVLPRNSERLAAAVRDAGGRVDERLVAGRGHAGTLATLAAPLRFRANALDDIEVFIRGEARDPVPGAE